MRPAMKVVENVLREPPYPDIRAKGFTLSLDWERIKQSSTWVKCPAEMRPWLLMVWTLSWTNVPAGTWDNDDELIAAAIGMDPRLFAANRDRLMRGWYLASDERLYHDFITTLVLGMAEHRQKDRAKVNAYRERQRAKGGRAVTGDTPEHHGDTPECHGVSDTGTGTGTGTGVKTPPPNGGGLSPTPASAPPDCPHKEILALWAEVLPAMPQHDPEQWKGTREDHLRARWRETATAKKWAGKDDGLTYFRKLFTYCGKSLFLTGRAKPVPGKRPFFVELSWLVCPQNWSNTIEGKYHEVKE